jgi:hypothetical protein
LKAARGWARSGERLRRRTLMAKGQEKPEKKNKEKLSTKEKKEKKKAKLEAKK